jgi:hypothetical protein
MARTLGGGALTLLTMDTTRIAGREVPVQPGLRTVVTFEGNCDPKDPAGDYDFWIISDGKSGYTGRRLSGNDPGDRFRAMEGQPGYEAAWATARAAVRIAPASAKQVISWLNSHPTEAACAKTCRIDGGDFDVFKVSDNNYELRPRSNTAT